MGGYQGLDYQALESAMRLQQIPAEQTKELFSQIRFIEHGALKEINKKV